MAKTLLREKARQLRLEGESVRNIAGQLGVAKSTASLWVRDIVLTVEQLETLRNSCIKGQERGRLMGALMQKTRRLRLIESSNKEGLRCFKKLTSKELLIAGLCLYWGEGTKKARDLRFCNSDPDLIKFMIKWLTRCFAISQKDLALTVGINEAHRKREQKVKEYWVRQTGIGLNQFRKTSFKKVSNKKVYNNYEEHYGTLSVDVLKPARFYYKIIGLIYGLSKAG